MIRNSGYDALAPLTNIGRSSAQGRGAVGNRIVELVMSALRKEKFLDREGGIFDDECIVHAREGDEELFRDYSDFVDTLRGYVIIPIEEYMGGKRGGLR